MARSSSICERCPANLLYYLRGMPTPLYIWPSGLRRATTTR